MFLSATKPSCEVNFGVWHELWLKVLIKDLRTALNDDCTTYEPIKLLRRGIELFKLMDSHADLCEPALMRELGLAKTVGVGDVLSASNQFQTLVTLSRRLSTLARKLLPGLTECAWQARRLYYCSLKTTLTAKILSDADERGFSRTKKD